MEARYARTLETLLYCQRFLDTHAPVVGSVNVSGSRLALDGAIREVENAAVTQDASARLRTGRAAALDAAKDTLRQVMKPVVKVAKSHLRDVPEFKALRLPRKSIKTAELVANAGAMVKAAAPFAPTFIYAGLAPTFLADIGAAADAVTELATSGNEATVERAGATAGVREAVRRGRNAVDVIDSLLAPTLTRNESLLAEWRAGKRVRAKKGPPRGLKRSRVGIGQLAIASQRAINNGPMP